MVKFRRSSGRASSSHNHSLSIPEKDPLAIVPPKKVIKALYDWDAPTDNPHVRFLSFATGEFLHVIGREDDTEWYEACNPLHNSRGLVPVSYFDQVGKTVRESASVNSSPNTHHDSGYADKSAHNPSRMSKSSISRSGGAPVYGVVAYDFKAERPDELEAHEGEAIIVIAQSNPEWFVAKPITRLGGPGLIPVSFVEIKDLTTGQTIDSAEAIARAGIPRVEEWKKMAADYKNTSIPLGSIGNMQPPSQQGSANGLQSGMDRMSLHNGSHSRHASVISRRTMSQSQVHSQYPLAPLRASVPRYMYTEEKFHFIVEATLADGSHWDLTRIYEDFYELQINLIKAFPDEAGNTGQPRTLPLMPGPVQFVTDRITEGRRENLDEYLYNLLHLGSHVVNSTLVRGFFTPRDGDYEVDPNVVDLNEHSRAAAEGRTDRYSTASHASSSPYAPSTHSARQSVSNQSFAAHQRQQSSVGGAKPRNPAGHYRTPSQYTDATVSTAHAMAPPLARQVTGLSTTTVSSTATNTGALKIKVWFDRETCVVLRLPARGTFNFDDLYRKILERRRLEYGEADPRSQEIDLDIEVRNERTGDYTPLLDDDTLEDAIQQNDKMMLVVQSRGR